MSDYLWDKTGEAEEDVEQLENLLGALRYQPRPLEIPATAMPTLARPRTTLIFSRPRLAIAASLLLTLLAGTWFVTRQGEPQTDKLAKVNSGGETVESKQTATAVAPNVETKNNASIDNAVEQKQRENRAVVVATATPKIHRETQRAPRQFVAKRQKTQPRLEENTPAPREEVAVNSGGMSWQVEQPLTPRQREATEQLMLALRLASAKLNYAQREMQEIGRAGK
ncbi:MAG TPA: hypothetical protein VJ842_16730 [Pyrinomonadaceae bacterium]|nr:hypothetical protein [Pyrinomonadaceae bacterium]